MVWSVLSAWGSQSLCALGRLLAPLWTSAFFLSAQWGDIHPCPKRASFLIHFYVLKSNVKKCVRRLGRGWPGSFHLERT